MAEPHKWENSIKAEEFLTKISRTELDCERLHSRIELLKLQELDTVGHLHSLISDPSWPTFGTFGLRSLISSNLRAVPQDPVVVTARDLEFHSDLHVMKVSRGFASAVVDIQVQFQLEEPPRLYKFDGDMNEKMKLSDENWLEHVSSHKPVVWLWTRANDSPERSFLESISASAMRDDDDDQKSDSTVSSTPTVFVDRVNKRDLRCVLTGAPAKACEAAHIVPKAAADRLENRVDLQIHDARNGILLRADIHKLWDNNDILISSDRMVEIRDPTLLQHRAYHQFNGKRLKLSDTNEEYWKLREELAQEQIGQRSPSHKCSQCPAGFALKKGLEIHRKARECPTCSVHFSSKLELTSHIDKRNCGDS